MKLGLGHDGNGTFIQCVIVQGGFLVCFRAYKKTTEVDKKPLRRA